MEGDGGANVPGRRKGSRECLEMKIREWGEGRLCVREADKYHIWYYKASAVSD